MDGSLLGKRQGENELSGNHNSGRKAKYLQVQQWIDWCEKEWRPFKDNELKHINLKIRFLLWLNGSIFLIVFGKLVSDFFFG